MAVVRVSHGEFVMVAAPYRGESVTEVFDEDPGYVTGLLHTELSPAEREVLEAVVAGDPLPETAEFSEQ